MPAISPSAAASSYPEVPHTWPARNRPGTARVSSVGPNWYAGTLWYSTA